MTRVIRKSRSLMSREARTLVQSILVAELLVPSDIVWLVSPWVNDVAVIANADGRFNDLIPDSELRDLHLSEVLAALARAGTAVVVAYRPEASNDTFITNLRNAAASDSQLLLRQEPSLHEKTLAGDRYVVTGSMNFTRAGFDFNEEQITLEVSPAVVSDHRASLRERWGPTTTSVVGEA
jgi:phosphatidylserine/phosphatidylglycerophosphate/cardiolipin synthase-like enzyme